MLLVQTNLTVTTHVLVNCQSLVPEIGKGLVLIPLWILVFKCFGGYWDSSKWLSSSLFLVLCCHKEQIYF